MLNDKLNILNDTFDRKRDEFLKMWEENRKKAIAKVTVDDVIENLGSMSFGNIISIFENISADIIKTKGGKKTLNEFVNLVKEDKNLQNAYMLKENVFSGVDYADTKEILDESIKTAKEKNSADKMLESKHTISSFVAESLKKLKPINIYEKVVLDEETKKINDNLDFLVWGKKTVRNTGKRTECLNETADFMKKNAKSESQEDVFEKCKKECIDTISEAWEQADGNVRLKLTEIKDKLSKKSYSEVTVENDIKYMKELINTIK